MTTNSTFHELIMHLPSVTCAVVLTNDKRHVLRTDVGTARNTSTVSVPGLFIIQFQHQAKVKGEKLHEKTGNK